MLINLQTCTIPYFKGNFIITDLFLYHGWTTVASGAARDENASLLFFVTPSSKGQLVRAYLDTILMTLVEPKITKSVYVLHTAICIL